MNNPCNICVVNAMCTKGCEELAEYLRGIVETGYYWQGNSVAAIYMATQIRNGRFELIGKKVKRTSDTKTMKIKSSDVALPRRIGP